MENDERMSSRDYFEFLRNLLIKIENALNLLGQEYPKHIPSYRKILGVQQKISGLPIDDKNKLFSQLICVRGIINYFLNGRYDEAYSQILRLKSDLVKICLEIEKNERDTNTESQKD
jgi:hypothetical protein